MVENAIGRYKSIIGGRLRARMFAVRQTEIATSRAIDLLVVTIDEEVDGSVLWKSIALPLLRRSWLAYTTAQGRMIGNGQFHLDNVLGKQFSRSMRSLWVSYPQSLSIVLTAFDIESVASEIERDLRRAVVSHGVNAWDTAFFRGLFVNPDAIENIRSRIEELVAV